MCKRRVGAIVLAAGASTRMGQPKLVLPWEGSNVIGHVVQSIGEAELDEVIVVTGSSRNLIEDAVRDFDVRTIFNPEHKVGEMLSSVQIGLKNLSPGIEAALITLGDQPYITFGIVQAILDAYQESGNKLIVPSFQNKRGHPWLVDKSLWNEIVRMNAGCSLRDFINAHQTEIEYINVNTDSILRDLDTMADYLKYRPVD